MLELPIMPNMFMPFDPLNNDGTINMAPNAFDFEKMRQALSSNLKFSSCGGTSIFGNSVNAEANNAAQKQTNFSNSTASTLQKQQL